MEAQTDVLAETLRVTVLGSSSSIPRPGRACAGYLIEGGGSSIVADLGNGVLGNLRRLTASEDLDAVVITHMHADHFLDVIPMRYELKYGPRSNDKKLKLYLPPDGEAMLRKLVDAFARESPADFIGEVFDVRTFDPARVLQIGETAIRVAPTRHYIPTFAVRFELESSCICYSSDSAPAPALVELARKAGMFLCEATLLPGERESGLRGHLSAAEAGTIASEAEVERLIVTHWPAETTAAELHAEASSTYDGPIGIADDLDQLDLI